MLENAFIYAYFLAMNYAVRKNDRGTGDNVNTLSNCESAY